jgi:hypothetical protein
MKKIVITLISVIVFCGFAFSQSITQTVRGTVLDKITGTPIIGANIVLLDSQPLTGTITDFDGNFILENVPVGRQSFKVSMLGYETILISNILVSSGKQVVLSLELQEETTQLNEIVLASRRQKEKPINILASVSSRQFSVEENQRFAGGLDDPARLVSSYAGVASPSTKSNGISIRGNTPAGLLWRIEGVEIPSPNHFADLDIAGAGALTTLSNNVLGNSDFYTGAFPAEYGNAISGVFDIKLRSGNTTEREYAIQAGILGLDFSSEGPFSKNNDATYLFNYRYSTLALIASFLPEDAGVLKYQDLSFKIKLPTKKSGTFSLWGLGAYDSIDTEADPIEERVSEEDGWDSQLAQFLFASGLNHKIRVNDVSNLYSTVSVSGNGMSFKEQYIDDGNTLVYLPSTTKKNLYKITLQSHINSYFNEKHYNRIGFYVNYLGYDLDVNSASEEQNIPPINIVKEKGNSMLYQLYSQSRFQLSKKLQLNTGFHLQYFNLNKDVSLEPRVSLKYEINEKQNLALAYGLHSRIESLPIYFVNNNGNQPNKDLELMKSNHLVLSYSTMLTDNLKLSIEPYYQYLRNVPVEEDGFKTTLNIQNNLYFEETLVSSGKGRNFGVDLSLEQYLNKGFYYLLSASVFDSKYTGNDGVERNTRLNKNYVFNALVGKEWQVGKFKNNLLSANIRFNYLGGNRLVGIDEQESIAMQEVVYGETNGNISFSEKLPDTPITSFTVSFRKNKPKHSSVWSLQVINATQTDEFDNHIYNLNTSRVEKEFSKTVIPNISYKIEF